MAYFLAPALVRLRSEVDNQFPGRDKSSDGWIGDPSHAARVSGHNPCWSCAGRLHGVVRAVDLDIDDNDPGRDLRRTILNACVGDPRVWYVISNAIIYSRTYGWVARKYLGSNGHFKHVHVELRPGVGEFDTRPWLTGGAKTKPAEDDDMTPDQIAKAPITLQRGKDNDPWPTTVQGALTEIENSIDRSHQALLAKINALTALVKKAADAGK